MRGLVATAFLSAAFVCSAQGEPADRTSFEEYETGCLAIRAARLRMLPMLGEALAEEAKRGARALRFVHSSREAPP